MARHPTMISHILFVPAPRLPDELPPVPAAAPSVTPARPAPPGLRPGPPASNPAATPGAQRGFSGPLDARIDGNGLAQALEKALAEAAGAGWEVRQIVPITSGAYAFGTQLERHYEGWSSAGAGYGFGYSYTAGLLVYLEQRA
jgi:hypothetical protein